MRLSKIASAAAAVLLGTACEQMPNHQPPPQEFIEPLRKVDVSGYVFDPEAFEFNWQSCGGLGPPPGQSGPPPCPDFAVGVAGMPHFEKAYVPGSIVKLFDPAAQPRPAPIWDATGLSTEERAIYQVKGVPYRPGPPYFPVALKPQGGAPPGSLVPPATTYFPTSTQQPIIPGFAQCLGIPAFVISDQGFLDAVAKHLTAQGTPTVAADFIDPTKYGGVVIWKLLMPGIGNWAGAPMATVEASAGQTFNLAWAPPGTAGPNQSARGFLVVPSTLPGSPIGYTVTVFPPIMGPPPTIEFHAVDPITDAARGRPWKYMHIPASPVAPGVVYYGQWMVEADPWEYPTHPANYMCLPSH